MWQIRQKNKQKTERTMNRTNHPHPSEVRSPADGSRVRMIYRDFCLASGLEKGFNTLENYL